MYPVKIVGTGHYLPKNIISNADLEKMVDTTDRWIVERTGIKSRRKASEHESASELAFKASLKALKEAHLTSKEIDMILVATVTPDRFMPSTACYLQKKLKAAKGMAFDLQAACSGFVYALVIASQFIKLGKYKNILVVGTEVLSRLVNYKDRKTCILFGDGAGAMVLRPAKEGEDSCIFNYSTGADGDLSELFTVPAGGSETPFSKQSLDEGSHLIQMKGQETFKHAVYSIGKISKTVIEESPFQIENIDWFVPHQANKRIIQSVAKYLQFPMEKVLIKIEDVGNTSAASIPIALDFGIRNKKILRNQILLISSFGAGTTSGSLLMRY